MRPWETFILLHSMDDLRHRAEQGRFRDTQEASTVEMVVAAQPEAVRLASDDWGGDAPLLFAAERNPGCQQWGLCTA